MSRVSSVSSNSDLLSEPSVPTTSSFQSRIRKLSRVLSTRQRRESLINEALLLQTSSNIRKYFVYYACPHLLAYMGLLSELIKHLKYSPGLLFMQFNFNSFSPCEEAAQIFLSQSEPSQYNKLSTLIEDKAEINAFRNFLSTFLLEDEQQERGFVAPPSIPSLIREALSLAKRHLFLEVGDTAPPKLLDSQKWLLKNAFAKGTLLHYACAGDQLEVVNYLLQVAKNSSTMVNNAGHSAEYYSESDSVKEAIWNCDMVCAMPVIQPKVSRLLSRASRRSTRASLDESAISKLIVPTAAVVERITTTTETRNVSDPTAMDAVAPPSEENQQPGSTPRGKTRRSSILIVLLKRKNDNNDATAALSKSSAEGNTNPRAVVEAVDLNPKQIVKSAMEKPLLERPMDSMLIRAISKLTPIETIAAEMQLNINVDPDEMLTLEDVAATLAAEESGNGDGRNSPSQCTVSTLDRLFQTIVSDEKGHSESSSARSRSASAPRSSRDEAAITVGSANSSPRADSVRKSGSSRSVSAPRSGRDESSSVTVRSASASLRADSARNGGSTRGAVDSKTSPNRGAGSSKSANSSRSASAPRGGATESKSSAVRGHGSTRSAGSSRSGSASRSASAPRSARDESAVTVRSASTSSRADSARKGGSSRSVSAPRSSSDSKYVASGGSDSNRRPTSRAATPVKTAAAAPSSSSRSISATRHRSDPKISSPPNHVSASRSTSVSRGGSREQRSSQGDYHELSFREMIWRRAALFINEPAVTMVPSPIFADEHLPRGRRAHDTITPGALRSKSVDRLPPGWREERNQRRMQQLICMQLRQEKEATIRHGIRLMRKEFQDLADVDEWPALRPKEKIKNTLVDIM